MTPEERGSGASTPRTPHRTPTENYVDCKVRRHWSYRNHLEISVLILNLLPGVWQEYEHQEYGQTLEGDTQERTA